MTIDYDGEKIYEEFPFCLVSDERLSEKIHQYKTDIQDRVDNRDFEYLESIGQTLIELEYEMEFRNKPKN